MKRLFALLLTVSTVLAQDPAPAPVKPPSTKLPDSLLQGISPHPNLVYATYGDRELTLDLYAPKTAGPPRPAIVCIHGGGWFKGDRSSMSHLAMAFAARGYVAVSISYRLSGEAKFPAAIQDAKAAVRWLRAEAKTYGIDAENIGVAGLSAGGHLAALLATSAGVAELEGEGGHADQSSAVQACLAMGAQSDLESPRIAALSLPADDPFYRTFLGDSLTAIPAVYAMASPRHHLDKSDPPILFMNGALDDPSTHAVEVRGDLEKLGIATGLILLPDAPHAFLNQQKAFNLCVEAADDFFATHLKSSTVSAISESFGDDFEAKRFSTFIPNKNTEVRGGAMWTRGESGGKYPPMVYLPVDGDDLEISFRYRHLGPGGWIWFFVDGDDGFGSVDHLLRVKLLREGVQLQIDGHSLDPDDPLRQKVGREADPLSGAYRLNEILPLEKVDLSANEWRVVNLAFKGEEASISLDGTVWTETLSRPGFKEGKRKLLWMQNGGEAGIEVDDIVVKRIEP
jgi:acetyl esterase/lipase